jgi:hypothetical protein
MFDEYEVPGQVLFESPEIGTFIVLFCTWLSPDSLQPNPTAHYCLMACLVAERVADHEVACLSRERFRCKWGLLVRPKTEEWHCVL